MPDVTIINLPNHTSGDTFAGYRFNALDEDGAAYDLTGCTVSAVFRYGSNSGTITDTFTIGDGLAWIDQAAGTFKINQQVISWTEGKYYYEIEITLADTTTQSPIKGTWTIKPQINP